MFELSAAELDGELAVELPARELMTRMHGGSFNNNNNSFVYATNFAIAKNSHSWDSSAEAEAYQTIVVIQVQK
jgi:hypothetical protein